MGKYTDFFFHPVTALMVFTIFIFVYLMFLDESGAFSEKFLHFGPGTTEQNTAKFIGMPMNTWQKVIMLYIIGFFISFIKTYYDSVINDKVYSYIFNKALSEIPLKRLHTYLIILSDPLLKGIIDIVQIFTIFAGQLQFILPQLIGQYVARIPFVLNILGEKEFTEHKH
jgi:hypothetical protein